MKKKRRERGSDGSHVKLRLHVSLLLVAFERGREDDLSSQVNG